MHARILLALLVCSAAVLAMPGVAAGETIDDESLPGAAACKPVGVFRLCVGLNAGDCDVYASMGVGGCWLRLP